MSFGCFGIVLAGSWSFCVTFSSLRFVHSLSGGRLAGAVLLSLVASGLVAPILLRIAKVFHAPVDAAPPAGPALEATSGLVSEPPLGIVGGPAVGGTAGVPVFCFKCGRSLHADASFCSYCGANQRDNMPPASNAANQHSDAGGDLEA